MSFDYAPRPMYYTLPGNLRRLQVQAYAQDAALDQEDRYEKIRLVKKAVANELVYRIAVECTETDTYQGFEGQHVKLDVYVLKPHELMKLIMDAMAGGQK